MEKPNVNNDNDERTQDINVCSEDNAVRTNAAGKRRSTGASDASPLHSIDED
jgi:hypothetical protein